MSAPVAKGLSESLSQQEKEISSHLHPCALPVSPAGVKTLGFKEIYWEDYLQGLKFTWIIECSFPTFYYTDKTVLQW